jgi:hypothetical protein
MKCWNCEKSIEGKPWDHLKDICEESEDGKVLKVEKYVCSYKCCRRLHNEHRFPPNLWEHIVNKEDYKGLISPVIPKSNQYRFQHLTHEELKNMDVDDVEKYYLERDEMMCMDPELAKIHDELINEDKRTEYLERESSGEESFDDY